jgi:hypothetical protein
MMELNVHFNSFGMEKAKHFLKYNQVTPNKTFEKDLEKKASLDLFLLSISGNNYFIFPFFTKP